ncbi:MAG: Clp protease N-terminal domain-containing protein [Ilumatobacteraceae bacterium]
MLPSFRDAIAEATARGHQWVGGEHLMLALVRDDRPTQARQVLLELGIRYDIVSNSLSECWLNTDPPIRSSIAKGDRCEWTPSLQRLYGWASGYMAGSNCTDSSVAAMLSLCADARGLVASINLEPVAHKLAGLGFKLSNERVVHSEDLARLEVPIDEMTAILEKLTDNPAVGFRGMNIDHENGRAFVVVVDPVAARSALITKLN